MKKKNSELTYPVHVLIAERWSPRAFADRSVPREALGSLLEAARCAPSCFNAQPWTFLVATREDGEGFERLASCLVEGNAWTREAPVLMLSVARTAFEHNARPNRHAWHDVGLAVENLVLQAQALGLATHQMAGFDAERARDVLSIPPGHEPVAMIAVGYAGDPDSPSEPLAQREAAPRERKPLASIVRGAGWNQELDELR